MALEEQRARYDEWLPHWDHYTSSYELWDFIYKSLRGIDAPRTFETGSGLTTKLFDLYIEDNPEATHTALEDVKTWYAKTNATGIQHVDLQRAPLVKHAHGRMWYNWQSPNKPYDLVLIDGPTGKKGRAGFLSRWTELIDDHTMLIIDDTHRDSERDIVDRTAALTGREHLTSSQDEYFRRFTWFPRRSER